jgi:glutathione S-transferase
MVLLKKGVTYVIKPVSPVKLPSWIEKDHRGELPVLVHEGRAMTGPMAIAEYIDQKYPQKSLTRQGVCSYQEALEKTRNFFPTVTSYVLNKDGLKDAPLKDAVIRELNAIEKLLITTPGRFLCGVEMTLADLFLLPQLFHAMVAMEHFKDFESIVVDGDSPRPVLDNYVDKMLDLKEFNHKKAYCGVDKVIFGWKVARGEASFHFRT